MKLISSLWYSVHFSQRVPAAPVGKVRPAARGYDRKTVWPCIKPKAEARHEMPTTWGTSKTWCWAKEAGTEGHISRDPIDGNVQNRQIHRQGQTAGCQGLREGWLLMAQGFLWGEENVLELDRGGGCKTCDCITCHRIVHAKMSYYVNCTLKTHF